MFGTPHVAQGPSLSTVDGSVNPATRPPKFSNELIIGRWRVSREVRMTVGGKVRCNFLYGKLL